MILFTILMLMLILLTIITIIIISIFGAGFIIVFGDVIVCTALIVWIVNKLFIEKIIDKFKKDKS